LSRSFTEPWDRWLQASILASREALGDSWLGYYLNAPIWCFALTPNLCGPASVAGVLMPSVDAVNRHFPLTIAIVLPYPASAVEAVVCGGPWFKESEEFALACLDPALDVDALETRLDTLAWPSRATPVSESAADAAVRLAGDGIGCSITEAVIDEDLLGAVCHDILDALLRSNFGAYSVWWTAGSSHVAPTFAISRELPPPARFTAFLVDATSEDPRISEAIRQEP
jgi:type VI secretion system protein ImpM